MGNQFEKSCNCGQTITMRKGDDGKWRALNADGTQHRCDAPRTPYKPMQQPQVTHVIGKLQRYNDAGAVLLTEGGILTPIAITAAKKGAWELVGYPKEDSTIWLDVEVGKDGFMIMSHEVPVPAWGQAAIQALTEGRAKPAAAPQPIKDHVCGCQPFTQKDKLIVAQTMLKAYTDLWIACSPADAVKAGLFDEARAEIMLAIMKDLDVLMALKMPEVVLKPEEPKVEEPKKGKKKKDGELDV